MTTVMCSKERIYPFPDYTFPVIKYGDPLATKRLSMMLMTRKSEQRERIAISYLGPVGADCLFEWDKPKRQVMPMQP